MSDENTTLALLKKAVRQFAVEREWEPFHSPKNLAMALAVEAAELMEHFLWLECDASRRVVHDPETRPAIADELADVLNLLLNLSLSTGIDLSAALQAKMIRNAVKYPAPKQ